MRPARLQLQPQVAYKALAHTHPIAAATSSGEHGSAPPTRSAPTLCPQAQPSEVRSRTLGLSAALLARLAAGACDSSAPDGPQLASVGLSLVLALAISHSGRQTLAGP